MDKNFDRQEVRVSGYGDYIALDFLDKDGRILSTPFYIREGEQLEVHWAKPSNEQPRIPVVYDDFIDIFLFKMERGKLFAKWKNGISQSTFDELNPKELPEWKFQFARKIKPAEPIK